MVPPGASIVRSAQPPALPQRARVLRLLHSTTVPTSRDDAWALLNEFTKTPHLIKHGLGVETAMRAYAPKYGGDPETWGVVGLIHDYDYERYPEVGEHAIKVQSVKKKFKDKAFARGVHREQIFTGAEQLGVDLDQHIQVVIDAMKGNAAALGLAGTPRP